MFLKRMKILSFLRKKAKKISKKEFNNKKQWLEGDGPQTD